MSAPTSLLIVDGNAPWVRSLAAAVPEGVTVSTLRVYPATTYAKRTRPPAGLLRWARNPADTLWDREVAIPGWTRFPKLSAALVTRATRAAALRFSADAILYTLPFYAPVARALAERPATNNCTQAYFAFDPYLFYGWDADRTRREEAEIIAATDLTLGISRTLCEDFRKATAKPVLQMPNAASRAFVNNPRPCPEDLAALPRPIVGVTGQINGTYDWALIESLVRALPDVTFCFIGPIFDEPPEVRARIDAALSLPNVRHLGPRPHAQLPAFQQHFDVCLNPLALTDHNNRRDPLRTYDYLCTDRPVISTPLDDTERFSPHLLTASGPEMIALVRAATRGEVKVDRDARSAFMESNTWDARARQLLAALATVGPKR
jgi:hypothetical protein